MVYKCLSGDCFFFTGEEDTLIALCSSQWPLESLCTPRQVLSLLYAQPLLVEATDGTKSQIKTGKHWPSAAVCCLLAGSVSMTACTYLSTVMLKCWTLPSPSAKLVWPLGHQEESRAEKCAQRKTCRAISGWNTPRQQRRSYQHTPAPNPHRDPQTDSCRCVQPHQGHSLHWQAA